MLAGCCSIILCADAVVLCSPFRSCPFRSLLITWSPLRAFGANAFRCLSPSLALGDVFQCCFLLACLLLFWCTGNFSGRSGLREIGFYYFAIRSRRALNQQLRIIHLRIWFFSVVNVARIHSQKTQHGNRQKNGRSQLRNRLATNQPAATRVKEKNADEQKESARAIAVPFHLALGKILYIILLGWWAVYARCADISWSVSHRRLLRLWLWLRLERRRHRAARSHWHWGEWRVDANEKAPA